MSDRTLYLDQSHENTGFVLFVDNAVLISGAWHLADGAKQRAIGFRELFTRLDAIHKGHKITQIVHESPVFGAVNKGSDQLVATSGLVAVIELFSHSRGLPAPRAYGPTSWRTSFFTKEERRAFKARRVKDWKHWATLRARQYGFDPASHDEAEAIGICHHDLLRSGIMPPWIAAGRNLEPICGEEKNDST